MKLPLEAPVMGALIVVKGLSLETFPLPHSCTPEASRFSQAESHSPVNRAVKSKHFQEKRFQSVIPDHFTAILFALVIM